ncbi:MAG: hypothetical protein IJF25_03785, partial [Oscillospiraceae bacterium]|nr:hypothetical protein [Oscillospiraceae bacterium]
MLSAKISFSEESRGKFGISGHVGVGHVNSHSGFVQDDSAGFAVASYILKKALDVDTSRAAAAADPDTGIITVTTKGGGTASAAPLRGI